MNEQQINKLIARLPCYCTDKTNCDNCNVLAGVLRDWIDMQQRKGSVRCEPL